MQGHTSHLVGKLTIDMGKGNLYNYWSEDTDIQTETDVKEWARNRLNELPMTFVELGEFTLEMKRFYHLAKTLWHNNWTTIDNCDDE